MQGLSSKGLDRFGGFWAQSGDFRAESRPVDRIADQGVAGMGQVDPDLVGAAGLQPAGQQARYRLAVGAYEALQHLPMGDSLPAALPDRHLVPGMGVAVDRLLDGAPGPVGRPPDEGEVAAFQ